MSPPISTSWTTSRLFSTSSKSTSSVKPRKPHRNLLEIYTTLHILRFIVSLLLLLALVWHFSSINLVENYDMPKEWQSEFLRKQFTNVNTIVWVCVFVFVLLDCFNALLCLDYYQGLAHARARDCRSMTTPLKDKRKEGAAEHTQGFISSDTSDDDIAHRRLTAGTPSNHHPLLHSSFPSSSHLLLLTLSDMTLLICLALHITSYFTSLFTNRSFCTSLSTRRLATHVFPPVFSQNKISTFNARQRCERLNVDVQLAGGFAAALGGGLAVLQISSMMARGWEVWNRYRGGGEGMSGKWQGEKAHRKTVTTPRQQSISAEEADMGVRVASRDMQRRCGPKLEPRVHGDDMEMEGETGGKSRLSEALLECLVP